MGYAGLAAALVFGSVFVGCNDIDFGFEENSIRDGGKEPIPYVPPPYNGGNGGNGGGPITAGISITSSYAALADTIAGLPANTAAAPHTVKLARTDITTGGVMGGINTAATNRYVILDLSDCYAPDNTITGTWENPGPNDMNVIKDNQYIVGVILPSGLTSIGDEAFWRCSSLASVTIPTGVTSIGGSAFSMCSSLASVTIPGSVTSIGGWAFEGCSGLASVTFGVGSSISQGNFYDSSDTFPGNLRAAYFAQGGGAGTYTRSSGSETWIKQ